MKIGFVSQPWNDLVPPVKVGSLAILTYEVARRMAASNNVVVFAKRGPGQAKHDVHDDVNYHRLAMGVDTGAYRYLTAVWRRLRIDNPFFASKFFYLGYTTQVALQVRAQKCDVVQLFNFSQFAPIIRKFNPDVKIVLRMSCEWLTQLDPAMIRPRLNQIDAVFGCSDFITNKIQNAFPEVSSRCRTILNGRRALPDTGQEGAGERASPNEKRLLFVGRVSPEKGIHVLLEAFERVLGRYPEARLDIVGPQAPTPREFSVAISDDDNVKNLAPFYDDDVTYLEYLRGMLSEQAAKRVRFVGLVPHSELGNWYREADLLVFPSIWAEPSGNPPIESMFAGLPVVSTTTGGTPEYVEDGSTGLLVAPNDPSALGEAIMRLLGDASMREKMGLAGRQRAVTLFSYDRMTSDLLGMYEELCDGGGNPG